MVTELIFKGKIELGLDEVEELAIAAADMAKAEDENVDEDVDVDVDEDDGVEEEACVRGGG